MTSSSRGRLPARVYWFRRALVGATALALVFAIAHVLGGSPAADPDSTANLNSAEQTPTSTGPTALGPAAPGTGATGATTKPTTLPSSTVLAAPDGPCSVEDVTVTPVAGTAAAGSTIPLTLQLTGIRPACTFAVTPNSLVAKVTAGAKRVWSSQDCPHAITSSSVVVRSGTPTTIKVAWSGRYSDSTCSRSTGPAMPGTYQIAAAAIGSEPSQAELKLTYPPRPVVTVTPKVKTPKNPAITPPKTPVKSPAKAPTTKPSKKATPDSGR